MIKRFPNPGAPEVFRSPRTPGVDVYGADYTLKTITIPLTNVQNLVEIDITSDFFWAISASDLTATMNVRFNKQGADDVPITAGVLIHWPINKIFVSNAAQLGKSITVCYGTHFQDEHFQMFFLNPASTLNGVVLGGNNNGVVERPGTLTDFADVVVGAGATVAILAAQATRRRALLVNNGAGAARIGKAPAAAQGALVQANGSITIMGTDSISAFGVAACTISGTAEYD